MAEIDSVFSQTRRCGDRPDVVEWGQLGLTGDWANAPISLYGRNAASGTYGFFKEHALCRGDFKDTVKEQPGSASVVQGITEDLVAGPRGIWSLREAYVPEREELTVGHAWVWTERTTWNPIGGLGDVYSVTFGAISTIRLFGITPSEGSQDRSGRTTRWRLRGRTGSWRCRSTPSCGT